jgi:hypothetical protein
MIGAEKKEKRIIVDSIRGKERTIGKTVMIPAAATIAMTRTVQCRFPASAKPVQNGEANKVTSGEMLRSSPICPPERPKDP